MHMHNMDPGYSSSAELRSRDPQLQIRLQLIMMHMRWVARSVVALLHHHGGAPAPALSKHAFLTLNARLLLRPVNKRYQVRKLLAHALVLSKTR
jgi:hypothetical protein